MWVTSAGAVVPSTSADTVVSGFLLSVLSHNGSGCDGGTSAAHDPSRSLLHLLRLSALVILCVFSLLILLFFFIIIIAISVLCTKTPPPSLYSFIPQPFARVIIRTDHLQRAGP